MVSLALGLGKTIVDGGITWTYSPAYPKIGPPYRSTNELLKNSQKEFWAINMGTPLIYDPIRETEYLVSENLSTAEKDGTLRYLSSTYDPQSDRLQIGMANPGPRVLNFAPLLQLKEIPLNDSIRAILRLCEEELGNPVEVEFVMTFSPPSLSLLQVRNMVISSENIQISDDDLVNEKTIAASTNALGNGLIDDIVDIVYVIPNEFKLENTRSIANELDGINQLLVQNGTPYLLIVFDRLGSSDPWLGIPVNWGQISGTQVIIETYKDNFNVDLSQGSHFFLNLTSLGVSYLSIPRSGPYPINWDWITKQKEIQKTNSVRHNRLKSPLMVKIDGKSGRGAVIRSRGENG